MGLFLGLGARDYTLTISTSNSFFSVSMNESSLSFSTRQPAAMLWPPTSAIVCGFAPLNVMTVFSRTSFRFLPVSPTILAETLILSSLYAIPMRIVPSS